MQQIWLTLLVSGALLGADGEADAVKDAKAKLQGVWSIVELIEGGEKAPGDRGSMGIEFKDDNVTLTAKGENAIKGTYAIDPKKSPATMDITLEMDGKEYTIPAIYELKDDTLKLCHPHVSKDGAARPKSFEATAKTILATLRREKP